MWTEIRERAAGHDGSAKLKRLAMEAKEILCEMCEALMDMEKGSYGERDRYDDDDYSERRGRRR